MYCLITVEQLKIKREEYVSALSRLEAALQKDIAADDLYLDGIIQRFEFTFELAWKFIKAYLDYEGIEAKSPCGSIKEGFKTGVIADGTAWLDMLEKRNLASHTYDDESAQEIYRHIKEKYFSLLTQLGNEMDNRLSDE